MKHAWTVICSQMITDKETNNVSLMNVLEELTIQEHPKEGGRIPINIDVATLWVRDNVDEDERGFGRLTLYAPSNEVLGQWETEIDLTEYLRVRAKAHFGNLPASEGGIYTFRMEHRSSKKGRWKKAAEVPLRIVFSPPDAEEEE